MPNWTAFLKESIVQSDTRLLSRWIFFSGLNKKSNWYWLTFNILCTWSNFLCPLLQRKLGSSLLKLKGESDIFSDLRLIASPFMFTTNLPWKKLTKCYRSIDILIKVTKNIARMTWLALQKINYQKSENWHFCSSRRLKCSNRSYKGECLELFFNFSQALKVQIQTEMNSDTKPKQDDCFLLAKDVLFSSKFFLSNGIFLKSRQYWMAKSPALKNFFISKKTESKINCTSHYFESHASRTQSLQSTSKCASFANKSTFNFTSNLFQCSNICIWQTNCDEWCIQAHRICSVCVHIECISLFKLYSVGLLMD